MNSNNEKSSILIVGSKGHSLAEKCIVWGEKVYVGDHDTVVINMTTLNSQNLVENIFETSPDYMKNLRDQIVEAQRKRGLKVFCIMDKMIFIEESDDDPVNNCNYGWSPIVPVLEETPGKKIDSNKLKNRYSKLIKGWRRLHRGDYIENIGLPFKEIFTLERKLEKIIINRVGRAIAFSEYWCLKEKEYPHRKVVDSNFPIIFLPEVDDVKEGIDTFLNDYIKSEETAPAWANEIFLPGTKGKIDSINNINNTIKTKEEEKEKILKDLNELNNYKKLLFSKGNSLERIVEKSFDLLRVKLNRPTVANLEDRFFLTEDKKNIYFEIRGVNRGMNEKDLTQLIKRIAEKPHSKKYKTRGVFVFNHYNELKPQDRKKAFHYNIIKQAKTFSICLITAQDLFKLIELNLSGKSINNFKEKIFNTVGMFQSPTIASTSQKTDTTINL